MHACLAFRLAASEGYVHFCDISQQSQGMLKKNAADYHTFICTHFETMTLIVVITDECTFL